MLVKIFFGFLVLVAVWARLGEDNNKPERAKACWRSADYRGAGALPQREKGKNPTCPKDRPNKSRGLCYADCKSDKKVGEGSLCWDDCSKIKYKSDGLVFCCESKEVCTGLITTIGVKLPLAVTKLLADIAINPTQIFKLLRDFRKVVEETAGLVLPQCDKLKLEDEADWFAFDEGGLDYDDEESGGGEDWDDDDIPLQARSDHAAEESEELAAVAQ
ncbi:hypothetical protein BASA81_009879 [Batrachochytrium salamandrivorans]|nr:hypothetical protein BASA81_009879 [Batrachochytrium salamandrivorans]